MRKLLGVLVVVSLVLTACSHPKQAPEPPLSSATTPASGSAAAPGTAGRVRVEGPDAGDVQVSDTGLGVSKTPELTYASDTYQLTPSGPRRKTTVHIALNAALPKGHGAVVASRTTADQPWTYLPATLSVDRASVTFTTTHFSLVTVLGLDLDAIAKTFKTEFLDGLSGGALQNDVPKPKCDREDEARKDGFKVTSTTKTDTVYWCFGVEHGRRVLKVTDHRRYPLLLNHPNMAVLDNEVDKFELSSLSHLAPGRQTVVGPGNTVIYNADLNPGEVEGVSTELDGLGQSLYALQVGIETLVDILTDFGGSDIARLSKVEKEQRALKLLEGMVSVRKCASALGKSGGTFLASCFTADQLITGLGTAALLVVPIFVAGSLLSFGRSEWNALVDVATGHDQYRIDIVRADDTAQVYGDYCGERTRFRPAEVVWGCEGSAYFQNMRWSKWGDAEALGTGTAALNDCDPSCGGGTFHRVPVSVRLSAPRTVRKCGVRYYSTITFAYTGTVPAERLTQVNTTYVAHPAETLTDWGSPC